MDMAIFNVFYNEIVNNEDEDDGSPFVAPKARDGGGLVVPLYIGGGFKGIVGEHTSLE